VSYLEYLKFKLESNEEPLSPAQLQSLRRLSASLSGIACQKKEQVLAYEPGRAQRCDSDEGECSKMLDLLVLTEMVVFSLLVQDQSSMQSGEEEDSAAPVESIYLTEELLCKFDALTLSEDAN